MLNKKSRFSSFDRRIQRTLKYGKSVRRSGISLKYLDEFKHRPSDAFAVIISKKIAPSAVSRNRIRRRIYEWVRLNWDQIKHPQNCLIMVFDNKYEKLNYKDLDNELKELFLKQ